MKLRLRTLLCGSHFDQSALPQSLSVLGHYRTEWRPHVKKSLCISQQKCRDLTWIVRGLEYLRRAVKVSSSITGKLLLRYLRVNSFTMPSPSRHLFFTLPLSADIDLGSLFLPANRKDVALVWYAESWRSSNCGYGAAVHPRQRWWSYLVVLRNTTATTTIQ